MSKKHRKISLAFIAFLLTLLTIVSFAEPPEAPNQLITENPYKEVKTVEANKNREHAEMNISVNKLNPKVLNGYKLSDTEYYIELPSEEILKQNEIYYISKTLEDLPDIYSVNGKKTIVNLNKFENYSMETADFNYGFADNIILIDKAPLDIKKFIISKLDKTSGEIKKVYNIDKFNTITMQELQGEIINDNSQIAFKLNDEVLNEFIGNKKQIKIGKTLKDILNKRTRIKKSLNENILDYELDVENKKLIVDNDNVLEELKIVVLNNSKIEKIYRGKRSTNLATKTILPTEDISIPEDQVNIPYQYIPGYLSYIIYDGERHNSIGSAREHFAKGNIVLATYRENPTKVRIFRLGGYVSKNTVHTITIGTTTGYEKTYTIREYPQKNILEKPIDDYPLNTELISENNTHYIGNLNLEYFIENNKVSSWENYLGLRVNLGDTSYYRKLSLKKVKNIGVIPPNLYAELKTTGFVNTPIGGYVGSTKLIGSLTGTYKIFFSRQSTGKIKVELDSRIINIAKKNSNLSSLVGGSHLTNNLSNWLSDANIKNNYSEMTKVTNSLNPPVSISSYITYIGRNILSQENRKQIFSNRHDNNKGLALPIGNTSLGNGILDGFNINLCDFTKGDQENAIFTYKGSDNKNYSGEIEISVGMQNELLGEGIIDLTNIPENQTHIFPKIGNNNITSDKGLILKNLVGNLPNTTSLSGRSILNNISFKIQSPKLNFEKIEGNINGAYPQEVILADDRLPFKVGLSNDGALKIEKLKDENFEYSVEISYRYNEAVLGVFNIILKNTITIKKGNTNINLSNPMVAGTIGRPPGRIRIYSNSISSSVPLIGNLGNDDMIISSDIKNGQYKLNKASGTYIPINPNELGGNKVDITINTGDGDFKTTEILTENSDKFNGMMTTVYNGGRGGIEVGVDYQESARSNYGTDISLTNWDLEAKNIKVTMKHPLVENIFNISVPEFNSEVYYDKKVNQANPTVVDYTNKIVKGFFIRQHSGEMKFKFNIGTKDYDLRILGNDNGKINLSIKIPKQVILEVIDSLGNKQSLPFVTEVTASTGILGEDANYYYIHAPNDGWAFNSATSGVVTLKTMYKTNISVASVKGTNLNLISIGAKSSRTGKEKRTTIVDKVDLKVELANFNETIDVSSLKALEKKYTTQGFYGLIQNENRIVLKEGETEIFATTFETLKATPQLMVDAGVNIGYSEMENKFEFTKERYVNYNKNLKLEIKTSSGLLLYVIDLNIINTKLETNATITFAANNFNFMQGDESEPYGRIRVYPTSDSNLTAKMGFMDTSDKIVTDNRKNGQFHQGEISGTTYPLQLHHAGKKGTITVGSNTRTVTFNSDVLNNNPIRTLNFGVQNGITTFVDYQALSISKGAIDFGFTEWNGEGQSIPMKVEYPDGAISNYNVKIPEFRGENYYNEELPLANEYLPTKKYKKEINEFMNGELDRIKLGTKNYDLRILGTDGSGNSNLRIKVPKEIELTAVSNENSENIQKLKFSITLENIKNGTKSDDGNYYIVKPNNNGYRDANSEMTFDVVLTGAVVRNFEVNNLVSLRGDIDLVSIGAVNPGTGMNKMTTIINQVEYKINFKNSSETIDFRDKNKGDIILGNTQFEALDTNKIHIKNKGVTILSGSILEFKKGVELPEAGVKISYSPAEGRLKFEKIGYKDYSNENLVLELRSKENLLLRVISLKLYNKVGFEILPGKGTLEFGDFFPGDFRSASSLIEFKNPTGAKLEITLDTVNNKNEMYKTTATAITDNTKIPLTNVRISDFKGTGNINSFIISGDAKTTETTETGIYKGELNVIITIIP